MSRRDERRDYTAETRIGLLETDADVSEAHYADLKSELKAINKTLTGVFIALATSAVLMAVNILVGGIGQ